MISLQKMHFNNNNIQKLARHSQMNIWEMLSGQKLYVESFTVCLLFYINLRGIFKRINLTKDGYWHALWLKKLSKNLEVQLQGI